MSNLKFVPNAEGTLISISKRNPNFGWVRLASEELVVDPVTGFPKSSKKSFLIKEKVENLELFLNKFPDGMPGKLIKVEFVESQPPAEFTKLLNKNLPYEEAVQSFIKRAGAGGPELTLGGERILHYTRYDASGKEFDILITHDNQDVVSEWNNSKKATTA